MVDHRQLLFNDATTSDVSWGAYPMVPFAGRIDRGRFTFDGQDYHLTPNMDDHAIHGTAFRSKWKETAPNELSLDLGPDWPLGGSVSHRGTLDAHTNSNRGYLSLELTVTATEQPMPAMVGWHPWFLRQLQPGGATAQLQLPNFDSIQMYEVGDDMIPTGRLVCPPTPGPWDHPFRNVAEPIVIEWPGELTLSLSSTCDHWVIYDHPEHAFCVEPQSGPPNIFNPDRFDREPDVIAPGESLTHTFTLEWNVLT